MAAQIALTQLPASLETVSEIATRANASAPLIRKVYGSDSLERPLLGADPDRLELILPTFRGHGN